MNEPVAFLYRKAEEIRALAELAPDIASDLRQMAEFIERRAAELGRRRDAPSKGRAGA
ncbi:MAG TPA: hypothetical protein VM755_14725 [Stellaceae bacterium]|nr:hypothetical protein [Stellaceae bacterium]